MSKTGKGRALSWLRDNVNHNGDDCLIWPYHRAKNGYGTIIHPERKSCTTAARLMCEYANGQPKTENQHAAHICGNGHEGCVNPKHLRWATAKENNADKRLHGTQPHMFSEDQVRAIRSLRPELTEAEIAERFGTTRAQIHSVLLRRSYAWVRDDV